MWDVLGIVSKGDYDYAAVPNHPKAIKYGYVLAHRIIMENHLGRLLLDDEVVHHKNGNGKDNRLKNLELKTASNHSRDHMATGRTMVNVVCAECGIKFRREIRNSAKSKGYTNAFCSRSCNGRYQRRVQMGL